jgi:hypothetical protein
MSRRSRNYRAHRRPNAARRQPREDGPYAWLPKLRRRGVDPGVLQEMIAQRAETTRSEIAQCADVESPELPGFHDLFSTGESGASRALCAAEGVAPSRRF